MYRFDYSLDDYLRVTDNCANHVKMLLQTRYDELEHIREAVRQEPNNQQYRMLLNRMEGGGSWYETQQGPFGGMPVAGDDMCLKLCLANALCGMCCPGSGVLCC